jgi:hypothetical protein
MYVIICWTYSLQIKEADLEGGQPLPPPLFLHKSLAKLKIWDPKYVNFLLGGGGTLFPLFEISGSATEVYV